MDVQPVTAAATGQGEGVAPEEGASAAQSAQAPIPIPTSGQPPQPQQHGTNGNTIAAAIAKLYNVTSSSSGGPVQLDITYKVVSQLQLVVTVFTNPETGQEIAQFPPQELLGVAEFFDQVDGVTLDRKV